uniref:Glutamate 5-kinase n=1 Tax=Zeugodacus cucurbitae TaxID=28588 RepID=A0A0A1WXG7_ZEUCU
MDQHLRSNNIQMISIQHFSVYIHPPSPFPSIAYATAFQSFIAYFLLLHFLISNAFNVCSGICSHSSFNLLPIFAGFFFKTVSFASSVSAAKLSSKSSTELLATDDSSSSDSIASANLGTLATE